MARTKKSKEGRNRVSPTMDTALAFIHSTEGKATPQDVVTKCGVSRATAYNAVKKYKESGYDGRAEETEKVERQSRDGANEAKSGSGESDRRTKTIRENAPVKRVKSEKRPVSSTTSNSSIPSSLRRSPSFNLDGFHFEQGKEEVEGSISWADIVYKGLCPVCTKPIDLYKVAIQLSQSGKKEIKQSWSGTCRKCNISVSLSKSRK